MESWVGRGTVRQQASRAYHIIFLKHGLARKGVGSGQQCGQSFFALPACLPSFLHPSFLPPSWARKEELHMSWLCGTQIQSGSGMSARLFRRNSGCLELQLDVQAPRGDHRAGSAERLAAGKAVPSPTSAELLVTWIPSSNRFDSGHVVKTRRICSVPSAYVVLFLFCPEASLPSAATEIGTHEFVHLTPDIDIGEAAEVEMMN